MRGVETTVTAPGKVLLTGGYLVLQRPLGGLVLALSSRFHTTVSSSGAAVAGTALTAVVESPQFDTVVTYRVELGPGNRAACDASNPYVANALCWSLAYVRHCGAPLSDLRVRLVADNDFYSMLDELDRRQLPLTAASLAALPPRLRLGSSMGAMRKTGLGSSAALVTSLVAAVCVHFNVADLSKHEDLERLHQLSQFVHCLAQGKIGSGFDVSSACFGSQRYVRFSPTLLDPLLKEAESTHAVNFSALFGAWDNEHAPLALPEGLHLILGDVSVGSNTPLMVSKVLAWKAANAEVASELWREINAFNEVVRESLQGLQTLSKDEIVKGGQVDAAEWRTRGAAGELLQRLRDAFVGARRGLKRMGELAEVPIEPDGQTRLCDASMAVRGVVCCGVPGAGGEDAVAALVVAGSVRHLQELWQHWKEARVLPMLVSQDPRGLVVVKHEI